MGLLAIYPAAGWPLLGLAILVGVERVLENAHYVSDVVGAIGLDGVGVVVVLRVMDRWMRQSGRSPRDSTATADRSASPL